MYFYLNRRIEVFYYIEFLRIPNSRYENPRDPTDMEPLVGDGALGRSHLHIIGRGRPEIFQQKRQNRTLHRVAPLPVSRRASSIEHMPERITPLFFDKNFLRGNAPYQNRGRFPAFQANPYLDLNRTIQAKPKKLCRD